MSSNVDRVSSNVNTLSGAVSRVNNTVIALSDTVDQVDEAADRMDGAVDSLGGRLDSLNDIVSPLVPCILELHRRQPIPFDTPFPESCEQAEPELANERLGPIIRHSVKLRPA